MARLKKIIWLFLAWLAPLGILFSFPPKNNLIIVLFIISLSSAIFLTLKVFSLSRRQCLGITVAAITLLVLQLLRLLSLPIAFLLASALALFLTINFL